MPRVLRPALLAALALLLPSWPAVAGQLKEVRVARHGDQIRVVIDLDSPAPFTRVSAPDGRSISFSLRDITAKAEETHPLSGMEPVTGFRTGPGANGANTQIQISADRPVEVVSIQTLEPGGGSKRHRIVIDIAPAPPPKAAPAAEPKAAPAAAPIAPVTPVATVAPPAPPPAAPAPPAILPPPVAAKPPAEPPEKPNGLMIPDEAKPAALPPLSPAAPAADRPRTADETARIEHLLAEAAKAQERRDLAKAMVLYHEAADAGSPIGAFGLGQGYRLGAGVEANAVLAAFWYGEAAKVGYPAAELNLGIMQLRGLGLHPDPVAGLAMIRRAAAHGNGPAQDLLDTIERAQAGNRAPAGDDRRAPP